LAASPTFFNGLLLQKQKIGQLADFLFAVL